jgi:hypothetical protein
LRKWTLLEYGSREMLLKSIEDRENLVLFYPAVGQMQAGHLVDLDIAVGEMNVLFPMRATVIARRTRPRGTSKPRGVYLEVVAEDKMRFKRLCEFADELWEPGVRRSSPRLRTELRASYFIPKSYHQGTIQNICIEGLFLRTDGPLLSVGQGLFVKIKASTLSSWLGLECRVCWIDPVESRRGMGLYCFGPKRALKRLAALAARTRRKMALRSLG